jgi:AAA family ATP:ADP antiporter
MFLVKGGVMEGLSLLMKFDFVKGIFALSCLYMIQTTVFDYIMKV